MDNSTRRQLLDKARSAGYPGSILEAFTAYDQGRDLIQEFVQQQQMQPQMQVAQTPQEQEQGLRPAHEAGNVEQSMAFPDVQPGQSFNTMGMKVPINIDKIDNQGNLVESYKAVPPGIANLPTGPYEGTVIESPARMQKGGFHQKIYDDPVLFSKANRAYNDSLEVYNSPKTSYNRSIEIDNAINAGDFQKARDLLDKPYPAYGAFKRLSKLNKGLPKPISGYGIYLGSNPSNPLVAKFKKPTEEPVYQEKPKGFVPAKSTKLEREPIELVIPESDRTLDNYNNTLQVLRSIQQEDRDKQKPKVVKAPNFQTGGPAANLPWLGTKGQVLSEQEQEEKLLDKKFGIGPTVDKAEAIKAKEDLKKTKRIETPLPSGAITPTMGPVEFALMAPVAGATALRAAPIIGSALNASIAGVPGLTVGNVAGAGFASDALVNRFPQIPVQLAKGEYSNAAVNAITGIGDLAGANIVSPFLKGTKAVYNATTFPKGFKGTSSFLRQIKGELKQGKLNRESIKEGNDWLEAWIQHPDTQRKINTDLNKQIKTEELLYKDPEDRIEALNLMKEQSKNFKPNSKEYPFIRQLDENFQQYLSNKARKSIHQGNKGVSYQHAQTPEYRKSIDEGEKPFSKYGSWISRDMKLSQPERISTTIHEGTHDWVSEKAFEKSGMRDLAIKNMNPDIKKDFLQWEEYRNFNIDPIKKMGKERAYQAYLADPTEQHARIMQLRHELGLGADPSYRMNEETAEGVLKWIDSGGSTVDPKFLKVIDKDPKKLAELFNKFWGVAPVAVAAGAMQEKKQMGGSYQTNQETAMYEWRSGLPEDSRKRYIKGGLKNRVLYNKAKYKR
jgi:uncharacterized membrane protein (UPF0127 family)